MAEVLLPLRMVERPASLEDARRVSGVGPGRRVAALERAAPVGVERERVVLHAAREAVAAAHHEPPVPVGGVRQQQLEVDLGLDHTGHPAVRRDRVAGGHRLRDADPQIDQVEAGEVRTGNGRSGRGRARGGNRAGGGNGGDGQEASNESHRPGRASREV